ncbi:MAG: amidohydrolase [Pseudohongiellaceae bacterium]
MNSQFQSNLKLRDNAERVARVKTLSGAALLLATMLLGACSDEPATMSGAKATLPESIADSVYIGEHIIAMTGVNPGAVAVRGDRILATGSVQEIELLIGESTRVIELGEQALLPGFIDAHGHFSALARTADYVDLSPPPVGGAESIADIVRALRLAIEQSSIPAGTLVTGFGYDDSLLEERRHPTRFDLDEASTSHPIVIRHVSGHLAVGNSLALADAGISAETPDPAGGIVRRLENGAPDGVMEETAMTLLPDAVANLTPERFAELRRQALQIYAAYGITTIQDSNLPLDYIEMLRQEAASEAYPVDMVAYAMANPLSDEALDSIELEQNYVNGFRLGGIKFTLDGSPQGRTAWLTEPYEEGPPGAADDYVAYPSYAPSEYLRRIPAIIERGLPALVHVNGDAAIDLMLEGLESIAQKGPLPDHRSVAIHAQLARPDQLDRMRELGVLPSFYAVHPFFWGDWHRLSFGDERASFISPLRAALDRGIPITIHNDSPVVPPDMMRLVAIAVNRETRSGYVLGPDQRVDVMEALHAVTLGAAYQYFEENEKGSLEAGKRADLVILAQDPRIVESKALADIDIVETVSRGVSVYRRDQ